MFNVGQFMAAEFPRARTAHQFYWWLRRPGQDWEVLGRGDLNPLQMHELSQKLEEGVFVLRTLQVTVPSSAGELDYWCLLIHTDVVYAARDTRGRLGYGVDGILPADMWAILTLT